MSEKVSRDSVLVIDDNPDFCELVVTIGQLYGVPVLTAPDCRKGLKLLTEEKARIKMILLDYLMPGMEPYPCVRALTAKAGPSVPVILVTAVTDPSIRAAELQLDRWLSKPVDPSNLIRLMSEASPVQRPH
jgi:CheY-like chemotaxis protein